MEINFVYILFLSSICFIISFIGGMVGLVLGVIRLPFILSTGLSVTESVGTNIGVSTLGAITAAIQHIRNKNISVVIFIIMAFTSAIGAFYGASLTKNVPINFWLILVGLIISYESFTLLKENNNTINNENNNNNNKKRIASLLNLNHKLTSQNSYYDIFLQLIIGFLVGVLGGLVGLVLGSIRLPVMIKILKTETKIAIGTNMLISSVMGMSGFIGHVISNEVNFLYLIVLGPSAMIGGFLGAKYTNHLSQTNLKRLIGIVLAIVAVTIFISQMTELKFFIYNINAEKC
ncbi:MAG TPA: sulfite exporter TauE/SafE family protein [Nitrososphaeraceae archaeon]|nr:sulfite exporter TauE/SafE family protein [Nitrososphaeraceae archaeon]